MAQATAGRASPRSSASGDLLARVGALPGQRLNAQNRRTLEARLRDVAAARGLVAELQSNVDVQRAVRRVYGFTPNRNRLEELSGLRSVRAALTPSRTLGLRAINTRVDLSADAVARALSRFNGR